MGTLMYLARAKALGAEVYALASSADKDDDIKKLGGDYIVGASNIATASSFQILAFV